MTTIAFDGRQLAADTQVSQGGMVVGYQSKIFKLADGRHVAVCGASSIVPDVIAWLEGGEVPSLQQEEGVAGIVVDPKRPREALEFENSFRLFPAIIPYASGSGMAIAFTAMRCGRTAAEAVKLACEMDHNTGGEVEVVHL